MFVPIPVLIAIGVAFLLLLAFALRSRGRDPLMGGGRAPAYRAAPTARQVSPTLPATSLPPEIEEQVRALLAAGRKIEAIKLARDVTHLGLKETKDLVESMR